MSNKIMFYSLKVGAFFAKIIPRSLGIRILGFIGYLFGMLPTNLHKKIYRIQRVIAPDLSRHLLKRRVALVVGSYAKYWWDVFYLSSKRTSATINKILTTEGMSYLEEVEQYVKDNDTGIIVVLPHMGSWEMAGAWVSKNGHPPVVVAERLEPPELFELFTKTRTDIGMTVIAHDDEPTKKLLNALNEKKMICLVGDRDISRRGVEASFFGKKKTFPAGAAALAIKTGAPILPISTYFSFDSSVTLAFEKPIYALGADGETKSVDELIEVIAQTFERQISRDPSQWHVLSYEWSE